MRIKITEQQLKTLRENVNSVEKTDEQKETAQIQRIYKSLETDSYFCVENYYSLKEILLYDKKEFKN